MRFVLLLSFCFIYLVRVSFGQEVRVDDSVAMNMPGIPADKLDMLREMPAVPYDLPGMWNLQRPYLPNSLQRLPPYMWRPAEISAKSLNIRYNVYDVTMPRVFKPKTILKPAKFEPLDYVERTRQSWYPFTFYVAPDHDGPPEGKR